MAFPARPTPHMCSQPSFSYRLREWTLRVVIGCRTRVLSCVTYAEERETTKVWRQHNAASAGAYLGELELNYSWT